MDIREIEQFIFDDVSRREGGVVQGLQVPPLPPSPPPLPTLAVVEGQEQQQAQQSAAVTEEEPQERKEREQEQEQEQEQNEQAAAADVVADKVVKEAEVEKMILQKKHLEQWATPPRLPSSERGAQSTDPSCAQPADCEKLI
eukprot:SAG11_NODE_8046_length_1065_cov_1.317805_2_plen_141_part_01